MSVSGGGAVRANAVITVDKYQPVAHEEPTEGPVLTRIHVEERFSGDIQGTYAAMQAVVRSMTAIARPIVNMSSDVAVDGFAGQDHMSQPFAHGLGRLAAPARYPASGALGQRPAPAMGR